jgi:copper chaperone CopZ
VSAVEWVVLAGGVGAVAFVIWYFLPGGLAQRGPGSVAPRREEAIMTESVPRTELRLLVEGMTCPNCVRHVRQALERVAGVKDVAVDLDAGTARVTIEDEGPDGGALVRAVKDAGYEARLQED